MQSSRALAVGLAELAMCVAVPLSLAAQQAPAPPTIADTACTYVQCSLWLDAGVLVQGAHGGVVARGGFFRPMRVLPFVAGDSARHHAAIYERRARRASGFRLVGATLLIAGFIVALNADCDESATPFVNTCNDDTAGPIAAGLLLGGLTIDIVGTISGIRGHRSLVRALWWHNSQYAR